MPQDQFQPTQPPPTNNLNKQNVPNLPINKKKLIFLFLVFIFFLLATSAITLRQTKTPTPIMQSPTANLKDTKYCSQDSDCTMGIQFTTCCPCAEPVNKNVIGKNDWQEYNENTVYKTKITCDVVCEQCRTPEATVCQNNICMWQSDAMSQTTSIWKTYKNEELGFEIRYPIDFYIREVRSDKLTGPPQESAESETNKIQISNHKDFEENEFALVITIEEFGNTNFRPSAEPRIFEILDRIGYKQLAHKFSYHTSGNFLGDPPWGYYEIAIASQSKDRKSILITTSIHRIDELQTSEGGTDGQLAQSTKQILSTFEFIDERKVIEQKLPERIQTSCVNDRDCKEILSYNNCSLYCVNNNPLNQQIIESLKKTCDATLWDPPLSLECGCIENICQLYE